MMKMVRSSLDTVRNMLGDETTQTEETIAQIQQFSHLEQLLMDQEARLDAVNKVLEEFNYSVAHELFAPLRRISGFTREIKQRCAQELDFEGIDYLNNILDSSQQMNELIEALMQVSHLLHQELQITRVDLSGIAAGIADELRSKTPERDVDFAIHPGLHADCDATLLKMAIRKLLENAWKYTGTREKSCIEFGSFAVDSEQVFFVRDNGVGFDMVDYDRLFHPFQRLHDRKDFPGNGLGLTAVKRIVERHGGRVWAEGVPDQGATFYFTLET